MNLKKAFLKVGSITLCAVFLMILTFALFACTSYPTVFETSSPYTNQFPYTSATTTYMATSILLRYIYVAPVSGQPGTTVTIVGNDYVPMIPVIAWFDSNGNSTYDASEPSVSFLTTAAGSFPHDLVLIVPSLPAGDYYIYIKTPLTLNVDYSIVFHVIGFPLATLLWIIGGVVLIAIIIVGMLVVNNQIIKKKIEKTREKFDKEEISLKMSNTACKMPDKPDTPFKADIALNIQVNKGESKQSIEVEGSLLRDGKEEK